MKWIYAIIGALLIGLFGASQASADSISILEGPGEPQITASLSSVLGATLTLSGPSETAIVSIQNATWTVLNFDVAVNLLEPVTGAVSDTFEVIGSAANHTVSFTFTSDTEGGPALVPLQGTITITATETGLPQTLFTLNGYASDASGVPHALTVTLQSDVESPIPEPTTGLLLATGLVGLLGYRWRQKKLHRGVVH